MKRKRKIAGAGIAIAAFVAFKLSGLHDIPLVAGMLTAVHFNHFAQHVVKLVGKLCEKGETLILKKGKEKH